jgi:hypothetical protein
MPLWRVYIILLLAATQCIVGCAAAGKSAAPPAAAPAPTSATTGSTTIVAIQPAAPSGPTASLCSFLGLDKMGAGLGGLFQRAFSRLKNALGLTGKFPGLQAMPPVLPITDPANLGPDAPPAVQAAAKAKMDEDQAGQKIQALRYLATLGCGGCYPDVESAMLTALDDCTESVRYEAALALKGKDGQQRCCSYCKCNDCCSDAVRKKLDEIANKMDDKGCYREPSERVRRVAREALAKCGGPTGAQSTTPTEGPTEAPLPAPLPAGPAPATTVPAAPTPELPAPAAPAAVVPGSSASNDRSLQSSTSFTGVQLVSFEQPAAGAAPDTSAVLATVDGEPLHESKIFRSLDAEIAKLKAQGVTVGPERFQALLIEQTRRSIDCRLLVRAARREQARVTGAAPTRPLDAAEIDAWLAQAMQTDQRISLLDLNARYQAEAARFRTAGQSRWEQVSVPIARLKSRDEAKLLISYLHNRAQGVPCDAPDVNLHAADIGIVDWTARDRIASPLLAQTISKLPAGGVSSILEENGKFLIVRVLEHRPGGVVPFDQVAETLRKEIVAERRANAERALLERLRAEAQVWTVFDPAVTPAGGLQSQPAQQMIPAPQPTYPAQQIPSAPPAPAQPAAPEVVPVDYRTAMPPRLAAPGTQAGPVQALPEAYSRPSLPAR